MQLLNRLFKLMKNEESSLSSIEQFKAGVDFARKTNIKGDEEIDFQTQLIDINGRRSKKNQFIIGFLSEIIQTNQLQMLCYDEIFAEHRREVKTATYAYLLNSLYSHGVDPSLDEKIGLISKEIFGEVLNFKDIGDLAELHALPAHNVLSMMKAVVADVADRLGMPLIESDVHPAIIGDEIHLKVIRIGENDVCVSLTHPYRVDRWLNSDNNGPDFKDKTIDLRFNPLNVKPDKDHIFGFAQRLKQSKKPGM